MLKPLFAVITALGLSMASVTAAYADGLDREELGKLLIGLAAIAAVNAALENRRDRSDSGSQPVQATRGADRSWADLNRPRPRREENSRELPYACLQIFETRFGPLRLFDDRCLRRNYRRAADLPHLCEVRIFTTHGPRDGYDPLCLRQQGYTTNRRH